MGGWSSDGTVPPAALESYSSVLFAWVRESGRPLKIIDEDGDGWELRPRKCAKS